ncbi:MAG: hypothetical protein H0T89_14675 [Deltaproteobacteria bacterium]|nr:hypothetical protein [Deltaproteobacteria bacterium]MDQ3298511.1 hypothetical protein [Myxococcota bacterium]
MAKRLMTSLGIMGLAALASGGCKWSEFDDLESEAWVESTQKPDNDSSNWAVAIQRGQRGGTGGKLAVLGASQALYNELVYTSTGDVSVATNELELNSQFGLGNIEPDPIFLADPASDDVAFVTSGGSASITVLRGPSGQLTPHQVFGPGRPDAATYMVAPNLDDTAGVQASQTLVAQDDRVFGTFFGTVPNPQPRCKLAAGAMPINVRGLGAVRQAGKDYDDVVVWTAGGDLYLWDGGIFNGARSSKCPDPTPGDGDVTGTSVAPLAGPVASGFSPGTGAQILTFGSATGSFAVLQGHTDAGEGFLHVIDLATLATIGAPRTDRLLRTATVFELAGKHYVVAGYPNAIVDGTNSGQALVFEVSATSGINPAPVLTLHDAQPETNQQFGRGMAVMPFDGKPVIVVAADNEIFTYFRTNLYPDVRSGR